MGWIERSGGHLSALPVDLWRNAWISSHFRVGGVPVVLQCATQRAVGCGHHQASRRGWRRIGVEGRHKGGSRPSGLPSKCPAHGGGKATQRERRTKGTETNRWRGAVCIQRRQQPAPMEVEVGAKANPTRALHQESGDEPVQGANTHAGKAGSRGRALCVSKGGRTPKDSTCGGERQRPRQSP